jgi:hypothetical protein
MALKTVAQHLNDAIVAHKNCIESGNAEWARRWQTVVEYIERNLLPSGAGIDNGTSVDWDESDDDRIVLGADYHHMDESGYYAGWSSHVVTVTPTFHGISVDVSEDPDYDDDDQGCEDYLADTYRHALEVMEDLDDVIRQSGD